MFIITHYCSDDSISNIVSINLANALDLAYFSDSTVLPSVWKQRYYFIVGGSLDKFGVVVVVIVLPKQEEMRLFLWGFSNDWKSSLSLMPILTWLLVIWLGKEYSKGCAPIESSQELVCLISVQDSGRCGITKVVLGYG